MYLALLIKGADEMHLLFDSFDLDIKSLLNIYEKIKGLMLK